MRIRHCIALPVLCSALVASSAQDASSAKKFVESLYAHYNKGQNGIALSGPEAAQYYHSSLIALQRTDAKLVSAGDVGVLDGDPICGCQDWDEIRDLRVAIRMLSPARAIASTSLSLGPLPSDLRRLEIFLIAEKDEWRIYNIRDLSDPKAAFDVRQALTREIRQLKAERTRHRKAIQ